MTTETETPETPGEAAADISAPQTKFSDVLADAQDAARRTVETVDKPAATEAAGKPETETEIDFIPEELRTKPAEKTETKVVAEVELPANTPKWARAAIERAKEHAATAATERDALKAELETLRKAPANDQTAAELKAEREQRAALEERLERADFANSPRIKAFDAREADQLAGAKSSLEGTEINPAAIDLAARLTGPKRIAALKEAGLDSDAISAIAPHLAAIDTINREKAAALDGWKDRATKWQQEEDQRMAQAEKQRADAEERLFAEVGKGIPGKLNAFKRFDEHPEWNKQVDQLEARAKQIFTGGLPMAELAEVAYRAAAQEVTDKMNATLRERVKTLTTQVGKLTAAQPSLGDARNGSQSSVADLKPGAVFAEEKARLGG